MARGAAPFLALFLLVPLTASAGRARLLDATVLGKVYPSDQVASTLQGSLSPLGACFTGSDAGSARGEIAFQLSPQGLPAQLQVSGELELSCVSREAVRWHFPPPTAESETPQVLVTVELGGDLAESSARGERERSELESFCTLFQQYLPRTQDPRELPRKVLRTLLAAGMTTPGKRWAEDMLATPPSAQLAVFQASVAERGMRLECPEYVGWHQRTFARNPKAPFDLVLVAAEGPSLRALLLNASVSEQWVLHHDAFQPSSLVLTDAQGKRLTGVDIRAAQTLDGAIAKSAYRSVASGSAMTLRDEPFVAESGQYTLRWGPYLFNGVAPGEYRARATLRSVADEWTDPQTRQHGVMKGLWKGTLESNEVRILLR